MKIKLKCFVFLIGLLVFNCKNENHTQAIKKESQAEMVKTLTEKERMEIVTYYLINGRQLDKKDFHEIIFLNDVADGVKVIHYEGKDAFFSFKFSEALKFYNLNKK